MPNLTLSVIIPVFNEEKTILEVIERLEKVDFSSLGFQTEIIIVDDGSTDSTPSFIKQLEGKYKVFYHPQNQGKGAAIKTALNHVTGEYVVIQDADLECHPRDIPKLLEVAVKNNAQIVNGSRWLEPKNSHPYKLFYWGGFFLTRLTNFLYGQEMTDVLSCYKLFKTSFLKNIVWASRRFGFNCEVVAKTARKGIKIPEVAIGYTPRGHEGAKKIRLRDGLQMIKVLLENRF